MRREKNFQGRSAACHSRVMLSALFLFSMLAMRPTAAFAQNSMPDNPEKGLQGQILPGDLTLERPYSKGVRLVGHTDLGGRGANMNLVAVDNCAYISSFPDNGPVSMMGGPHNPPDHSRDGVAVIEVSYPSNPKQVNLLRDKGSVFAVETIHAVSAPGRKVLVAGAYTGGQNPKNPDDAPWLDVYDVSNCKNPKLMSEVKWPANVHMVTISPNGKHVYGTIISPFDGKGGLFVLDISDMTHPNLIGKFGVTRPDGTTYEMAPHDLSISADERRLYVGVVASRGNDLNLDAKPSQSIMEKVGPNAGGVYILDNTDIVDGRPDPKMRLVGTAQHGGWHSPELANINGIPHLVSAGELGGCPGTFPKIINIADEKNPYIEGEFKLASNRQENCAAIAQTSKGVSAMSSSHFNDVDSSTDTRLGLFPFVNAGLRIADLRDPKNPVEIGYFRPGDACVSQTHYVQRTGQIWFACGQSGFYVIELKPEVRSVLGLPKVSSKGTRQK